MTAVNLESTVPRRTDEPLDVVLSPVHELWVKETRSFLLPAAVPNAPFWDRWTSVRYLSDQFLRQYRRERALVDELRSFLPVEVMGRLSRDGDRIAELRLELDRVGRRRGTAQKVAALSRELSEVLARWCSEIEIAAGRIPQEVLPEEAARLVIEFENFQQSHA